MKKSRYISILLTSVILLSISGCKSKQSTLATNGQLEKKTSTELLNSITKNEIKYNTIECKGKIELKKGTSSKKTTAVFKLVKDSLIQISVRPILGAEAIRMTFSPSGITLIDRLSKQYSVIKYSELNSIGETAPTLFYNMQDLFTNKLFIPGQSQISPTDYDLFSLSATEDVYMLQAQAKDRNLFINFAVDATDHVISTLLFNKDKTITFQWSYLDFVVDQNNNSVYPTTMDAKIQAGKHRLDLGIECPQLDIDNKNFKVDTNIPAKYEKVEFGDVLSKYMGLIK